MVEYHVDIQWADRRLWQGAGTSVVERCVARFGWDQERSGLEEVSRGIARIDM